MAFGYIGSHSRRNCNKAAEAGLTPLTIGESVSYEEAELTGIARLKDALESSLHEQSLQLGTDQ